MRATRVSDYDYWRSLSDERYLRWVLWFKFREPTATSKGDAAVSLVLCSHASTTLGLYDRPKLGIIVFSQTTQLKVTYKGAVSVKVQKGVVITKNVDNDV